MEKTVVGPLPAVKSGSDLSTSSPSRSSSTSPHASKPELMKCRPRLFASFQIVIVSCAAPAARQPSWTLVYRRAATTPAVPHDARRELEEDVTRLSGDEVEHGDERVALDGGARVEGEQVTLSAGLLDLRGVEGDLCDTAELAEKRGLRQHAVQRLADGAEANNLHDRDGTP